MHIIFIASFLCSLFTASTTITNLAAPRIVNVYNVKCSVDHDSKTVTVFAVNNKSVDIVIAPPGKELTRSSSPISTMQHHQHRLNLHLMHHFPGVASTVFFPSLDKDDRVVVLMSNGALMRATLSHVVANFHTHDRRMVYGQLRSIAITDYSVAEKIYVGAPIFKNGHMVSVVTCRHDDFNSGVVQFPVTGARSEGLILGHVSFDNDEDNNVAVHKLDANVTIYGTTQLPYVSVSPVNGKKFALIVDRNRSNYRDLPRKVVVFHNDTDVLISLVEGQFEMQRIHFDGPLVKSFRRQRY
ncbi:p26 [Malacosoma neustria nucleopolyhedrovirus]|uniref:p26 n=1 Tax=Malacosoma neustria nuclear polyhedrosis virus TaxID=38012 RepID=UPI000E35FEBF|nr:p26 [Malacosoma neustria nucleopolyhedrovirus]AUF81557.1 p26 [Malacosoma neustria nucleopolyhedrovirus]